jgi:hypothetical protein
MNALLKHQRSSDATSFQHLSANHACCAGDAIPFIADRQSCLYRTAGPGSISPGFVPGPKSGGAQVLRERFAEERLEGTDLRTRGR